jgi:hypothetical protein
MAYAFSDFCVTRLVESFSSSSVARFVRSLSSGPMFERSFSDHFRIELDRFDDEMAREALALGRPT